MRFGPKACRQRTRIGWSSVLAVADRMLVESHPLLRKRRYQATAEAMLWVYDVRYTSHRRVNSSQVIDCSIVRDELGQSLCGVDVPQRRRGVYRAGYDGFGPHRIPREGSDGR